MNPTPGKFIAAWLLFVEGWLFGYFLDWKWAALWILAWLLLVVGISMGSSKS